MAEATSDIRATVLVLGGYGLIGLACMEALDRAGFRVLGAGRSGRAAAATRFPDWHILDLARTSPRDWADLLAGVDVVVNAAGALQDGASDDLRAIHVGMIEGLLSALGTRRLIQISAAGVSEDASTHFFRTKARGDALVRAQAENWVILRPTLVLAREAWGGTALLRATATLPGILPTVLPDSAVQTVHVDDVAQAVVEAAQGRIASGITADLTGRDAHSLPDLTRRIRAWLGLPKAREVPVPYALLATSARVADALGHLGWRSPLRTTALAALSDGVRGDPSAWEVAGGTPCRTLDQTLADITPTRADRMAARMFFALPLSIATLSAFWILSGVIGLVRAPQAVDVLDGSPLPQILRDLSVLGGGIVDIALGAAIMWKPWARRAALGMVVVSALYLAGSVALAPHLWADPLGPMLKVIPGAVLALLVWQMLEER